MASGASEKLPFSRLGRYEVRGKIAEGERCRAGIQPGWVVRWRKPFRGVVGGSGFPAPELSVTLPFKVPVWANNRVKNEE